MIQPKRMERRMNDTNGVHESGHALSCVRALLFQNREVSLQLTNGYWKNAEGGEPIRLAKEHLQQEDVPYASWELGSDTVRLQLASDRLANPKTFSWALMHYMYFLETRGQLQHLFSASEQRQVEKAVIDSLQFQSNLHGGPLTVENLAQRIRGECGEWLLAGGMRWLGDEFGGKSEKNALQVLTGGKYDEPMTFADHCMQIDGQRVFIHDPHSQDVEENDLLVMFGQGEHGCLMDATTSATAIGQKVRNDKGLFQRFRERAAMLSKDAVDFQKYHVWLSRCVMRWWDLEKHTGSKGFGKFFGNLPRQTATHIIALPLEETVEFMHKKVVRSLLRKRYVLPLSSGIRRDEIVRYEIRNHRDSL